MFKNTIFGNVQETGYSDKILNIDNFNLIILRYSIVNQYFEVIFGLEIDSKFFLSIFRNIFPSFKDLCLCPIISILIPHQ